MAGKYCPICGFEYKDMLLIMPMNVPIIQNIVKLLDYVLYVIGSHLFMGQMLKRQFKREIIMNGNVKTVVFPDPDWEVLMSLFGHRCVLCERQAVTIHEIEPKSHGKKKAMEFDNRVAICNSCHVWVHRHSNKDSRELLKIRREEFLKDAH